MNAMNVNQLSAHCSVLANDLIRWARYDAKAPAHTRSIRMRKLSAWLYAEGKKRDALTMDAREFMTRCPAAVRDAARDALRAAKALRRELQVKREAACIQREE